MVTNRHRMKLVDQYNQINICLMLAIIDQRTECKKRHRPFRGGTKFTTDFAKAHIKGAQFALDKIAKLVKKVKKHDEDDFFNVDYIKNLITEGNVKSAYSILEVVNYELSSITFDMDFDKELREFEESEDDEEE